MLRLFFSFTSVSLFLAACGSSGAGEASWSSSEAIVGKCPVNQMWVCHHVSKDLIYSECGCDDVCPIAEAWQCDPCTGNCGCSPSPIGPPWVCSVDGGILDGGTE